MKINGIDFKQTIEEGELRYNAVFREDGIAYAIELQPNDNDTWWCGASIESEKLFGESTCGSKGNAVRRAIANVRRKYEARIERRKTK